MLRHRPTAILVIAILHIVGASIGIFGSCYTGVLYATMAGTSTPTTTSSGPAQTPSSSDLLRYCADHCPGYWGVQIGTLSASLLLDVMLMTAGVGLLKMKPWARTLSVIYAPASILFHIVTFIYQIVYVVPATREAYEQYTAFAGLSSIMSAALFAGVCGSLIVVIYPIVVLVIMLKQFTIAAFRGDNSSLETVEAFEDDPWREPPRSDAFTR